MRSADFFRLALDNLLRNRSRSLMTLVGVMIGVAALLALLAYGAGLQRNARGEFQALELYNTLRVTSRPNPFTSLGAVAYRTEEDLPDDRPEVPLTDSFLAVLNDLDGVLAAYPEVTFPVQIEALDRKVVATAEAVPMAFGTLPAYRPSAGTFFTAATDSAVLVAPSMARRLGFEPAEAIVGRTITVNTATLDLRALQAAARAFSMGLGTLPIRQRPHPMRVAGLLPEADQRLSGFFRVILPLERARTMQKITFFSTLDLLLRRSSSDGYAAVRVQLTDVDAYQPVRRAIEARGVYVTSFREQFSQLERLFLIMDLALGIIGFIALLVATIGIANTMLMNVLERYREIGIMKALGGDEVDLQKLFLVESLTVGLVGGVLGLLFGWLVTGLLQLGIDYYLQRLGIPHLDIFHTPPAMALGILVVAALVSLAAGVLPARKAARIEPLQALRSV